MRAARESLEFRVGKKPTLPFSGVSVGLQGFHVCFCQIRSSPVCMVMNKLPLHPPVFILTPSQRPTLICIHTTDLITLLYSTII
jgi:hypothetical protein